MPDHSPKLPSREQIKTPTETGDFPAYINELAVLARAYVEHRLIEPSETQTVVYKGPNLTLWEDLLSQLSTALKQLQRLEMDLIQLTENARYLQDRATVVDSAYPPKDQWGRMEKT